MKQCIVISGFYVEEEVDGQTQAVPKHSGATVDLPDDIADDYSSKGWVEIISHDGQPVGYGACCGGH